MQRSDYGWSPLSYDQYTAIITSGAFPNTVSPMLNQADYDSLIAVMQPANIDPRLPLAFCWAEGHDGTDPGLAAARVNNLGGIKYSGAPGTTDSGIPADTGGTYAAFPDLTFYFREWVRVMNNRIIGPDFQSGNLVGAVEHYTDGPGTGHNKIDKWQEYVKDFPPDGTVAGGVYGEDIVAALIPHLGEERSDNSLDPWNRSAYPNHLWAGFCESASEGGQYAAGLADVVHRGSAAEKLDAVTAQGLLQTSWPPEDGGICLWGRDFDPNGHTTVWSAKVNMWVSTLFNPSRLDYYYSDSWKAAMKGWYRAPGVLAANRTTPLPAPTPTPAMPFFVDGNPYGAIPVPAWAWARWDALNTMGQKLDHPGVVNPDGLALPTLGYPMQAQRVLATGRRVQRYERGWLATQGNAAPFDCVLLMVSEFPTP